MAMRRTKIAIGIALLMFGATAHRASALDLSLSASAKLGVTAGLDQDTINLINNLPKEIHDQLIATLTQALPLIDQSVDGYLDKINEIMDHEVNKLECSLQGSVADVSGEFKKALSFSNKLTPIEDLKKAIETEKAAITENQGPDEIINVYSDLLYNAVVVGCQVQISSDSFLAVDGMEADVRQRLKIWRRVRGLCKDGSSCFDVLRKQASDTISRLPRDAAAMKASERFAAVTKPAKPGFFERYDTVLTEDGMIKLAVIQDGVLLAQDVRLAKAADALSKASAADSSMVTALNAIRSQFQPMPPPHNCEAAKNAQGVLASFPSFSDVLNLLMQALQLDPNTYQAVQVEHGNLAQIGNEVSAVSQRIQSAIYFDPRGVFNGTFVRSCNL